MNFVMEHGTQMVMLTLLRDRPISMRLYCTCAVIGWVAQFESWQFMDLLVLIISSYPSHTRQSWDRGIDNPNLVLGSYPGPISRTGCEPATHWQKLPSHWLCHLGYFGANSWSLHIVRVSAR